MTSAIATSYAQQHNSFEPKLKMKVENYDSIYVVRNFLNASQQSTLFSRCIYDFNGTYILEGRDFPYVQWYSLNKKNKDEIKAIQHIFMEAFYSVKLHLKNEHKKHKEFDTNFEASLLKNKKNKGKEGKVEVIGISYLFNHKQGLEYHTDGWSDFNLSISLGKPAIFSYRKNENVEVNIQINSGDVMFFPGNQVEHAVKVLDKMDLPEWCHKVPHFKMFNRFNLQMRNRIYKS